MKKLLYLSFVAIIMVAISCSKEDEPQKDTGAFTAVVGTWLYHTEDFPETMILNADSTYSITQELYKEEGTFLYGNNSLSLTPRQAWRRDWVRDEVHGGPITDGNGNYQYTDWETTDLPEAVSYSTKLLYNGDAFMLKQSNREDQEVWAPYIKNDATHVSNVNDIQGKWYWLSDFGDYVMRRVIVNVNGNTAEVIITPWGERYTGAIRYEKGILYMDNPTFTTTRYEGEDGEWEHMNENDPESSDWREPSGENAYYGSYATLQFTFVADGNKAYGGIANLLAAFSKQ